MIICKDTYYACIYQYNNWISITHGKMTDGMIITSIKKLNTVSKFGDDYMVLSDDEKKAYDILWDYVKDKLYEITGVEE